MDHAVHSRKTCKRSFRIGLLLTLRAAIIFSAPAPIQFQILLSWPDAAAAFSADGILGAFSDRDNLTLIDLSNWKFRWHAAAVGGSIQGLAFSNDGSRLAVEIGHFRNHSPLGEPRNHFVSKPREIGERVACCGINCYSRKIAV